MSPTVTDLMRALADAARTAQRAPSVFNTQPWRWRVGPRSMDLLRDRDRSLPVTDPAGRELMISCGAALHHARTALSADGRRIEVVRFPAAADPELVARINVLGRGTPDPAAVRLSAAIRRRRTDRRAFADTPVREVAVARLGAAARGEGCGLHRVRLDQMPMLAVATAQAADAERAEPAYRAELAAWTNRPPGSGDGVPPATAVRRAPRRVPIRDFAGAGEPGLTPGPGDDRGAVYAVLHGPDDTPAAWLRAGEALSAVLLTAVVEGIAAAPISDVLEVERPRRLVRGLLPGGEPYLVLRFGIPATRREPPQAPRRPAGDVIDYE